ncbi:hypothetical protein FQ192_11280 [Pseudomonas sp. ANT_J12]|jgi:hypothetical protein|uniref:hypothetical protein n=1 Tax=Pseudomonas sp. ANT_J12 TaxID=2597351 RepID=UPI0011F1A295|nr:hypothetical protein [Pseudomonas sp. ANT_J12]KAA0994714.1 hypothetical protein FQ192_11280 [Pseudomonas sp. ANT_J12]
MSEEGFTGTVKNVSALAIIRGGPISVVITVTPDDGSPNVEVDGQQGDEKKYSVGDKVRIEDTESGRWISKI